MSTVGIIQIFWTLALLSLRYSNAEIHSERISVENGQGFLISFPNTDASLQKCQLSRKRELFDFPPGQNTSHSITGGEIAYPLLSKSVRHCGVRVFKVSPASTGEWSLSVVDESGKKNYGTTVIEVRNPVTECPSDGCTMINEETMEKAACGITEWRNYKCLFWSWGRMTPSELAFKSKKSEMMEPAVIANQVTLFECIFDEFTDIPMKLTDCYIEHVPTGRMYNIEDGLQDEQYSAFDTNFGLGICQFEIPHGVTENDTGIWKMTVIATNRVTYSDKKDFWSSFQPGHLKETKSCKFYAKGNETAAKERLLQRSRSKIPIKTLQPIVTIECAKNVYYPIEFCYLMTAEGLLFANATEKFDDGICEFKVGPGNWTCGFNGPTNVDAHFKQQFEVIQYSSEVIDGAAKSDDNVTLSMECHLITKRPISLCIFVSPSGEIYALPSDEFKSDEFSYYDGGKMATGDCGIKFKEDVAIEPGKWQCMIVKGDGNKLTADIDVE